jgi:hypothetical protein
LGVVQGSGFRTARALPMGTPITPVSHVFRTLAPRVLSPNTQAYTGASLSSAISDKAPQVSPTTLAHVLVNIGQPLMVRREREGD